MGGLLVSTLLINNPNLKIAGAIISAPLYRNSRVDLSFVKTTIAELNSYSQSLKNAITVTGVVNVLFAVELVTLAKQVPPMGHPAVIKIPVHVLVAHKLS